MSNLDYISADLNSPMAMVKMDITNILYEDNSFDVILCSHVLEHVVDDRKAMRELFRVLKIGGVVIWVVGDASENGSETGTSFRQAIFFKEIGFNINDTMIYYKNNPMPTSGPRYHQHFEYMFCFSKGQPKTFNPIMEECKYNGLANMKNRGTKGELNYKKMRIKKLNLSYIFMNLINSLFLLKIL